METNLIKLVSEFQKNPELKEKLAEEVKRLSGSGEAAEPKAALAEAIRNLMGFSLSADELDALTGGNRELAQDELKAAGGGYGPDDIPIQGMPMLTSERNLIDDILDTVKNWWDGVWSGF